MKTYNNQLHNNPTTVDAVLPNSILITTNRVKIYFLLLVCFTFLLLNSNAQAPIVNVSTENIAATAATSYNASGAVGSSFSGNSYNYTFGAATQAANNQKKLNRLTIGQEVYNYVQNANSFVKIRRVNNSIVSGKRSLLWLEKSAVAGGSANKVAVIPEYNDNMESVFDGNSLNQGTDNLFANQGDENGNNNNIERLDVIFAGGVISTYNNKVGFALFERGADNAHDPFVIAAITSIDQNGSPTGYANPIRISTGNWGNIPSSAVDYYVVRRDPLTESNLRMSTSGKQNIGGVFITLKDLGIATGVKIYGYSVMAYDLPSCATAADLVDYTNTTYFPTNTSSATSQGGIDLIALTGVLSSPEGIILPPTANNIEITPMMNTSTITAISPLDATAPSGNIDSYTILSIASASQGSLHLCNNGSCIPIEAGQVLTPAEINMISFVPNPSFTGSIVFNYSATDIHQQVSNIATYTIPVTSTIQSVLPVNMISFTGNINDKLVRLNWQTSQENNSSYYEVQRSSNGSNYEPISTITTNGNTSTLSTYQEKDDLFFYTGKVVYYRLKMVDTDGKFKFSKVLVIKINTATTINILKAWPLPFNSQLTAGYSSDLSGEIKINITHMNGSRVASSAATVQKGYNSISINQAQTIPSGTYLLTITSNGKSESIKVVKQ